MRPTTTACALCLAAALLPYPAAAPAGSYDIASHMLISDIVPGTEQVRMIADGGMEAGGTAAGWKKKGGSWGAWTVGPHLLPAPGICGKMAVYCDNITNDGSHQIDNLPGYQPHWRQEFSLYAWLPGSQCSGMAPGVPGDQHICFFRPMEGVPSPAAEAWNEGAFIFGDFRPMDRQLAPAKVSYNIKGGVVDTRPAPPNPVGWLDAKGQWRSVVMAGDNMADTPAIDFAPPVLRYAAIDEFTAVAAGEPAGSHNATAAGCMLRFLRGGPKADDELAAALAAWQQSLADKPNQPLVAYWLALYKGYVPAGPYVAPKPPAGIAAATAPATGPAATAPAADARLLRCTYLRARDVLAGAERARLAPNGDFSAGAAGWQFPASQPGLRVADVSTGLTSRLAGIGRGVGNVLVCEAPLADGAYAEARRELGEIRPGRYVISAWITPLGIEPGSGSAEKETAGMGAIEIGLEGGQSLWWGWPARHSWLSHEGFFAFATVRVDSPVAAAALRVRVGPWRARQPAATLKTADGKSIGVCAIIDDIALTPADEFRPPLLRHSVALECRRVVEDDPATPAEVRQLLKSDDPDALAKAIELLRKGAADAAGHNRLAAACMAAFAREPSRMALWREAVGAMEASLRAQPDQPAVKYRYEMLRNLRPPAGQSPDAAQAGGQPRPQAGDDWGFRLQRAAAPAAQPTPTTRTAPAKKAGG
jgi:hypothetical protein